MHAVVEVGYGRSESQVKMIAQEAEGMDLPVESDAGIAEGAFECLGGTHRGEQVAAIVSAIDDMVNCSRKLNAKASGHTVVKRAARFARHANKTPIQGIPRAQRREHLTCNRQTPSERGLPVTC